MPAAVTFLSYSGTVSSSQQLVAAALAFAMVVSCDRAWALPRVEADGLALKLSVSLRASPKTPETKTNTSTEPSTACQLRAHSLENGTGTARPSTLQQTVDRARLSNPEITRAMAQLRKARADVDTAGSAYAPQLRLNASSGRNGAANGKLASAANAQLSKLLHDFGKTDNLIEEARKREEGKIQEHGDTINRITLDIVEAWLNAARQSEMARLHQRASGALQETVRIVRLRAEAGLMGSGDVELAQARLAQTQAAGMTACLQREQSLSRLSMLSGGPVDDSMLASPTPLMGNGPTSSWDPSILPGVRQAEAEHQAAVHHVQSVKAARWPSLYVQAARATGSQSNSAPSINLTLSMDVLEAGIDSRIESTSAEVQAALLRVQSVRESAEDSFRRIQAELQSIDMRRPLLESQAVSTAATRRNFLDQFLAGRRQVLDLLNTHQEVLAADVALANIGFDRMVLIAKLHGLHDELSEMVASPPATSSSVAEAAISSPSDFPAAAAADAGATQKRTH